METLFVLDVFVFLKYFRALKNLKAIVSNNATVLILLSGRGLADKYMLVVFDFGFSTFEVL